MYSLVYVHGKWFDTNNIKNPKESPVLRYTTTAEVNIPKSQVVVQSVDAQSQLNSMYAYCICWRSTGDNIFLQNNVMSMVQTKICYARIRIAPPLLLSMKQLSTRHNILPNDLRFVGWRNPIVLLRRWRNRDVMMVSHIGTGTPPHAGTWLHCGNAGRRGEAACDSFIIHHTGKAKYSAFCIHSCAVAAAGLMMANVVLLVSGWCETGGNNRQPQQETITKNRKQSMVLFTDKSC